MSSTTGEYFNSAEQSSARSTGFLSRFDFPALGYSLLPLLLAFRYLNAPPDDRTYGPSHWFLNYHHGFVRRALVGQMFSHVAFLSWRKIFVIEALVLFAAVALTYLIFRSVIFGTLNERRFAALLLAAPAFLPHMAVLSGEIDNFLYFAIVLAGWALLHFTKDHFTKDESGGSSLQSTLGLALATVFTCVGLAMHEGFLLMFYPLVITLILDLLHRKRLKMVPVVIHFAVVAICFLVIMAHGKLHGVESEWIQQAQQRTDMPIEGTVFVALHNTLSEQVHFVAKRYTPNFLKSVTMSLLLSIPYFVILWRLLRMTVRERGYSVGLSRAIYLSFFMPLLLLPLGHDAMRWLAALCIDMSLYILFLYGSDRVNPERMTRTRETVARFVATPAFGATLLYLFVIGPWGIAGNRFFTNFNKLFH